MDNTKPRRNLITIFSAKIARDLIKRGFVIRDIGANNLHPEKTAFGFEDTPELRRYLLKKWGIKIPKQNVDKNVNILLRQSKC